MLRMVSMKEIRSVGQSIGRQFHPRQVLLFGSHARGTATEDSDVDLLVVMPFEGRNAEQSAQIMLKVRPPFPVDILVRTPQAVRKRIAMGDDFMRDILTSGKVLYDARRR